MIWVVHLGSGSLFVLIPDPVVKKAPDPGSLDPWSQQSGDQSQQRPTQWNLRGGR
jgi:hypothetical protein